MTTPVTLRAKYSDQKLLDWNLRASAERLPDKECLVFGDRRWKYGEVDRDVDRAAHALRAAGVERGDRVCMYLDNSIETVQAAYGTQRADAAFSVVNPLTKANKLAYVLNKVRATALVTSANYVARVEEIRATVPSLKVVYVSGQPEGKALPDKLYARWDEALAAQPSTAPVRRAIDQDLATVIFTSGSTGDPKGVMLTHGMIVNTTWSISTYLENVESDRILSLLPLAFDYGFYNVHTAFRLGATAVVEKGFAFPWPICQRIMDEKITGLPFVPTIWAMLLALKEVDKVDWSLIRYVSNTAAALPPAHIQRIRGLMPQAKIFSMYGQTECTRTLYMPPEDIDRKPGSVGGAIPNEEVWLEDESGKPVTKAGEFGELVVRGAGIMRGYWEDPDATAKWLQLGKYRDEVVLRSQDLFTMDEDGYLYFVSRRDDMIKVGGQKVSPREVESVLHTIEGIAEAAVIGLPDPMLGQIVKAAVVRKEGSVITEAEVRREAGKQLEDFMVPKLVEFVPELPKTTTGKVKKADLK